MSSIEGIPEGWELVKFDVPQCGDWVLDPNGEPLESNCDGVTVWPIIRKIEKPKTYRPFANAAEYMPHWGKPVKCPDSLGFDSIISTSELGVYTAQGRMVQFLTMEQAFGSLAFADGSPFGVEVTE